MYKKFLQQLVSTSITDLRLATTTTALELIRTGFELGFNPSYDLDSGKSLAFP